MYCKYCGKPQDEGLFCKYCGKRQYAEEYPAPEISAPEIPSDEFPTNDFAYDELPAAAESDTPKSGAASVVKGAAIGFLAAAVGIAAVLGVMLSINGKPEKNDTATMRPQSSLAEAAAESEDAAETTTAAEETTETTTTITTAATTTTTTTTTVTEPEPVVPEVDDSWKDAYMQAIDDFVNEFRSTPDFSEDYISFSLYNADEDDIPELIIHVGSGIGVPERVYTYYDGRVVMLLETDGSAISDICFPTVGNKVYLLSMPGAGIFYTEYEIRDGQVYQTDDFMIDYDHSLKEERGIAMAELPWYDDAASLRRAMDEY